MEDVDYGAWSNYIKEIWRKRQVDVTSVLELACGTGSLSKELIKDPVDLTCLDLSVDMLAIAESKLRSKGVKFINQDMTRLNLAREYDSILCICDSLNYISNEDDLENFFRSVYDHLRPGGLLIFDINSPYKLRNELGNNSFVYEKDNIFYTWENYYDEEEDLVEFYLNFFIEENGVYTRFSEDHVEKVHEPLALKSLMEEIGYKDIEILTAFEFSPYKQEDQRINFVASK